MAKRQGYIKVFRQILDWEWYSNINVFRVFFHLLLKANHKRQNWQGIVIERGSLVTSFENLAIETGLTVQQVRTAILKLKSTNEITSKSTSRNTLISIKNYNRFQENNKQNNKQITNKQQTNNKQITTNNTVLNTVCINEKNEKNDNNILFLKKNKKPSFQEIEGYCNQIGRKIDIQSFIDYYEASEWKDKNGLPVNWKQKIISWAKNTKAVPFSIDDAIEEWGKNGT